MEEIEIGEYVRDKTGIILKANVKVLEDYDDTYKNIRYEEDYDSCKCVWHSGVTKHSKNIIDLIEVGDYVNGHIVEDLDDLGYITLDDDTIKYDDIKSIVTKEQFKSIEYEV